jgi:RNA polymerase sigma-70 factor, ECF subfamily
MADRRCDNDEQRFVEWVQEHGKAVHGFLWASVRRADVAEELTQEVFCRAWQARSSYREQGTARAYLLRIADRLACDRNRRNATYVNLGQDAWRQYEPVSQASEPPAAAVRAEENALLAAALDQLSPPQRRVLLLRYYGQLSFAEIAEQIGCPLNTTLSHCHRGLKALQALLVEKESFTARQP